MNADKPLQALDDFDAVEWFDVCRKLRPGLTQEEFDALWGEFQADKAEHLRQERLQ